MTEIEKLKRLTGERDEVLLQILLDDAEQFVLSYTGRTRIVTGLEKAVRDLAVIALNRMGTEGESGPARAGSHTVLTPPRRKSMMCSTGIGWRR